MQRDHKAMCVIAQENYTYEHHFDNFVRYGDCFKCNRSVYDDYTIDGKKSHGYNLATAGNMVITHCPHCGQSFID